jgi:mono/diheme cytochrome c family protein
MRLSIWLAAACVAALPLAASAAPGDVSVERGRQVSIIGGCNDCHTVGYNESGGKIDPATALKGSKVGWQGPWGTTYPANIRLKLKDMTEDEFVTYGKSFTAKPPMPFYNVHAMDESDLRSFYMYVKSLGDPGEPAPEALDPGVKAPGFVNVLAAPNPPQ